MRPEIRSVARSPLVGKTGPGESRLKTFHLPSPRCRKERWWGGRSHELRISDWGFRIEKDGPSRTLNARPETSVRDRGQQPGRAVPDADPQPNPSQSPILIGSEARVRNRPESLCPQRRSNPQSPIRQSSAPSLLSPFLLDLMSLPSTRYPFAGRPSSSSLPQAQRSPRVTRPR